jgi:AraC-like DNA-binding protein
MRFETVIPTERLRPFITHFVLAEHVEARSYKVLPGTGLVAGFQYAGRLSMADKDGDTLLATAGITGMLDKFRDFKNSAITGSVLVYFTPTGLAHFSFCPVNELFGQSVALDHIFDRHSVQQTEEELSLAKNDAQRITAVEKFFLSQLKEIRKDHLIIEAVKTIYIHKGNIRIADLSKKLLISQSPLEKRFRRLVGSTPGKFASVVRFNAVLKDLHGEKSLTEICYEHQFFDQAHFIHDFRQYTGSTPGHFRKGSL